MYSYMLMNLATGHGRLRVEEILDEAGGRQLELRLADALAARCTCLEVDCSRVRRLGLASVEAIARAGAHLRRRGGSLTVTSPSEAFTIAARFAGHEELVARTPAASQAFDVVLSERFGPRRGARAGTLLSDRGNGGGADGSPA